MIRTTVDALRRLPAEVVIALVRGYQWLISPLLGPTCRFTPTCSQYFIESVRKHGVMRGSWRGAGRILRCHPFHPGGFDPP
jgi:uncharacterized protein